MATSYYVRAELDGIDALSEAVGPTLRVNVRVALSHSGSGISVSVPDTATSIRILSLDAQMFWYTPAEGGSHQSLFLASGVPYPWYQLPTVSAAGDASVTLLFPLHSELVGRIEEIRHGDKARFQVVLRISGTFSTSVNTLRPPRKGSSGAVSWTGLEELGMPIEQHQAVLLEEIPVRQGTRQHIEVEKSRWAEEILPGLGWGMWRTVEIPLAALQSDLGKVDDWLHEAEKQLHLADWPASLTASRRAVEAMKPYFEKYINPVHTQQRGPAAAMKATDLTDAIEAWAKSAMGVSEAARKLLHAGAHDVPSGATLERADAELGLMFAVALRRYVGLRMRE